MSQREQGRAACRKWLESPADLPGALYDKPAEWVRGFWEEYDEALERARQARQEVAA